MMVLWVSSAWAESWCASPLVVHEWGVHVINAAGVKPASVPVPSWFHDDVHTAPLASVPVRDLPPDSGERALPVVQFYGLDDQIPVALEVGFRDGSASSWWPATDRRTPADQAGSLAAARERERLVAARKARTPTGTNPPLGPDPTKQLGWDRLTLTSAGPATLRPYEQPWVAALRGVPGAKWVVRGRESDRFVYYEATTRDAPDVVVERAGLNGVVRNRSDWDLHDVLVVSDGRVWKADAVPHGGSASFALGSMDRAALVAWLRDRWVDPAGLPQTVPHDGDGCVMMRDPAVPVEKATGYRLYGPEVDVVLSVWADRLLDTSGTRVVYREDPAALDARLPMSVYTDMFHYVELDRLGLVVVEGL